MRHLAVRDRERIIEALDELAASGRGDIRPLQARVPGSGGYAWVNIA